DGNTQATPRVAEKSNTAVLREMLKVRRLLLPILLLMLASSAFATLGEDVSSVQSDQVKMKAVVRVSPNQTFSVHEIRTPTGAIVREFVSPAGTVFGVTWQGPFAPDLRQLLGRHFDEYVQAAKNPENRRGRSLHIDTGDLVVESGG